MAQHAEDGAMEQHWLQFEEFLWDSFCEGRTHRELRLSTEELAFLQQHYPHATCAPCDGPQVDEKCWYMVHLPHCFAPCGGI